MLGNGPDFLAPDDAGIETVHYMHQCEDQAIQTARIQFYSFGPFAEMQV
jgi:hypothetical protein